MRKDMLLDTLLDRLEGDSTVSDEAALWVYAAFEGPDELRRALEGAGSALPDRTAPPDVAEPEPVGAYLQAVTVTGFRGIGPTVSLPIQPGPGLTVVAGRNGSGKSSFAEAIEYALTGHNLRWDDKDRPGPDWRSGWRNFHHRTDAALDVELLVEGSTPASATVRHRWADDADLDAGASDVVRPGGSPLPVSSLGWDAALGTFRPFLSYNELGEVLSGKASELYDALWSILGLERINETHVRLKDAAHVLKVAADDAKTRALALAACCAEVSDERAQRLATGLRARQWDRQVLQSLVSPEFGEDDPDLAGLAALAALTGPRIEALAEAADGLRGAATRMEGLRGTDAERAALDADLLEQALRFHEAHGDGQCPVCGAGLLDQDWHRRSTDRVQQLRTAASAVLAARAGLDSALAKARALMTPPPAELERLAEIALPLASDPGATWQDFAQGPAQPAALADHLELAGTALAVSIEELNQAARAEFDARQDLWRPIVTDLAAWLDDASSVQRNANTLKEVTAAAAWVKTTAEDWANARLEPLSRESSRIWEALRQESNVELGPVRLAGTATHRRVQLDVTVDEAPGSALGVMSQGELHALALSLFLPRATVPESPFRFLVIDDPVQAMDPAKVDGLARVLADVAEHRQVVVFTHDDRLPAALRRLQLSATVLEVTRQHGSQVAVVPCDHPALRHLRDAVALTKDSNVPGELASRLVPGLCRLALDAACIDRIRATRLGAGADHVDVERLIEDQPKLYPRMALALFDDEKRTGDVLARLKSAYGTWAVAAFKSCNSGAHAVSAGDLTELLNNTRTLVQRLQQ